MIKVEHINKDGNEGVDVNITGNGRDLMFEAMSACEGMQQLFADKGEDKQKLTELACKILRGEVTNYQWQEELHEITHDKLDMKKFLEGFADFLKGLADKEEDGPEC